MDKSLTEYIEPSLGHQNILLQNCPDAGYEYFWLNFKDSVRNIELASSAEIVLLESEVTTLTLRFNLLKAEQRYDEIGQHIQSYLKRFFRAVLVESQYHKDIAFTNFKRWNKCCRMRQDIPCHGITVFDPFDDEEMQYIYFLHSISSSHHELIKQHIQAENDRASLLYEVISLEHCGIFGKFLEQYPDWTWATIHSRYGVSLPKGMLNGNKAMKCLQITNVF
jgi:hypothetical protein